MLNRKFRRLRSERGEPGVLLIVVLIPMLLLVAVISLVIRDSLNTRTEVDAAWDAHVRHAALITTSTLDGRLGIDVPQAYVELVDNALYMRGNVKASPWPVRVFDQNVPPRVEVECIRFDNTGSLCQEIAASVEWRYVQGLFKIPGFSVDEWKARSSASLTLGASAS